MRHLQGDSRHQTSLLPESLDEFVPADHPVRVIDAFVDSLDTVALGFSLATTKDTGRKPYNPADLLKLYVYGYLNQVRSSRRLEKECHRNLELLWLMKRLAPDFKTIANFRQHNGQAIRQACGAFVRFCQDAKLLSGSLIAIDGSKFRAAASKDQAITQAQVLKQRQRVDHLIDAYLDKLNQADLHENPVDIDRDKVEAALARLRQCRQQLDVDEHEMTKRQKQQHCRTEPEASLMRSGREGMVVGYNIQSAVDAQSGLIVHHQLTDNTTDNRQLEPMSVATKNVLKVSELTVIADAGYSNGEQLAACEEQGITPVVPSNRSHNNQGDYFQKHDFAYDSAKDEYRCPAGEILSYKTYSSKEKLHLYARTGCSGCSLQPRCTKVDKRWVTRHFFEDAFERSEARLKADPQLMVRRMAIVERPFATLKHVMGMRRFLCWGKRGAASEMGIGVLSYNLNRMINQVGVSKLLDLIQ
jgi:transposase